MKVIFITGLGRSGTNLLDLILDAHSQVQGLGEIQRLAISYANRGGCACGVSDLHDCDFWSRVDGALNKNLGVGVSSLELEARNTKVFNRHNRAFFESVAEVSGTTYITDNSKSPRRLRRLLEVPGIEVVPLQITRDPRGCAYSQYKRKRQYIGPAFTYNFRYLKLYQLLRNREHIAIDYEQLAQDPERLLRDLTRKLDLEFESQMLEWASKTHHNIGSAKGVLRNTEGSVIREDNTWKRKVPKHKQALINFITWPSRTLNSRKNQSHV